MSAIISFLIAHSVELAALFVALCALVVIYLTAANQHKPQILIYYRPNVHQATLIDLVVENIGAGFAYDIQFDQPLKCGLFGVEVPDSDKEGKIVFENGIPYLASQEKLSALGGQFAGIQNWVKDEGKVVVVTAYYKNLFSFPRKIKFVCQLQINHLQSLPTRSSADQAIVDSLRKTSSSVFYLIFKELERQNNLLQASQQQQDSKGNHRK